jgi:flagellar biogenesis protein FliO
MHICAADVGNICRPDSGQIDGVTMQFITSLIGGSGNTWLTALFALGIVVVLIVLGVWLLKLVFNASTSVARGRNRRLAVVDTLALDPKRQLLIIRRDNVEHLLLVGGPQDLVVEAGIPVEETQAAQPTRRPIPVVATPQASTTGQSCGSRCRRANAQGHRGITRSAGNGDRKAARTGPPHQPASAPVAASYRPSAPGQ